MKFQTKKIDWLRLVKLDARAIWGSVQRTVVRLATLSTIHTEEGKERHREVTVDLVLSRVVQLVKDRRHDHQRSTQTNLSFLAARWANEVRGSYKTAAGKARGSFW